MAFQASSEETRQQIRTLENKALQASVWSILEYGSGMGLRVVSSLVLTRLLLPAYFGEITLVTTLVVGINLLSDIGLAPSVIQSQRGDDPVFLNTAWTLQVVRGLLLALLTVVLAWPASAFYHDQQLRYLLLASSFGIIVNGFNSTNLLSLARHMAVRRLFAIDGSTSLVSLVMTISWAYIHPSVWAIVGGQLLAGVYRLVVSFIPSITPGIRNTFRWESESVHDIVHFGKWLLMATAFTFFATQADRLIFGRLISLTLLGIYGLAAQISDIPRQIISALGNRVAYPFIAKIIHQPLDQFRIQFLRYRRYVLLVGAALISLMVTWGSLLIIHLYDKRYHEAAWMIPILALGLWQTLLYQTTYPVLLSMGKAKYNAFGNAAFCGAICLGLPLAFHFFKMQGAVISVAAADFPLYLAIQFGLMRQGLRLWIQDLEMTSIFIVMLVALRVLKAAL